MKAERRHLACKWSAGILPANGAQTSCLQMERRHPACKNGKPYNAVALFPLYAGRMPALHFPFNLQTKKNTVHPDGA